MKLSQSLNDALNQQILKEFHNELVYRQIQSYFEDFQLKNLAAYFEKQANEENGHGKKFIQYINDRTGGKVLLNDVDGPNLNIESFASIGDIYVSAEEATTESIESIYELALDEKSFIDLPFIQSMLFEQVEEEDSAQEFMMKIKMVKDIVLFDAEFGD